MRKIFITTLSLLAVVMILLLSCRRELSCESCADNNKPPLALAGPDQVITSPTDSVLLDGSRSSDPDGTISKWQWTKISGPASFVISNATAEKTMVKNLTAGVYQFELKVTDAGGLFSKDTVQVTSGATSADCGSSNRPTINAQLVPIGQLSKARIDLAVASAGTKIIFAGGVNTPECPECWGSPQVDIYDTVTKAWTTAKLSTGRWGIKAIAAGDKIFFAGGEWGDGAFDTYYTNVDIYDASANSWSVAHLSETRSQVGVAVLGNNVFFAGGEKNMNYDCSNRVDIYNLSTNTWFTATLSLQRAYLSAVSAAGKVYFAGGTTENRWYTRSNMIDIYDSRTNTWSTSVLKVHDGGVSGTVLHDNIYWYQGCPVEIRNGYNGTSQQAFLSRPATGFPVVKNGTVVFVSGGDRFDIYDPANNTWSIGLLPHSIKLGGNVISVNNTIYFTDGVQVYKILF